MRQVTIELDEMTCKWLEHILELSGQPIENLIANGISNQMIAFEETIFKAFSGSED